MRAEKKQLVQDIQSLIDASPSLFLISYKGLAAEEFNDLRGRLSEAGSECHVVPNRLFSIAVENSAMEALDGEKPELDTALVTTGEDPVQVAKVLRDFAKSHPVVAVKNAVVDGKLCTPEDAAALADLPPLEILQAQFLSVLQAPSSQLARVLHAKVASVVYALNAYLNEKEQAA